MFGTQELLIGVNFTWTGGVTPIGWFLCTKHAFDKQRTCAFLFMIQNINVFFVRIEIDFLKLFYLIERDNFTTHALNVINEHTKKKLKDSLGLLIFTSLDKLTINVLETSFPNTILIAFLANYTFAMYIRC